MDTEAGWLYFLASPGDAVRQSLSIARASTAQPRPNALLPGRRG